MNDVKQLNIGEHVIDGIKNTIPFIVLYSILMALSGIDHPIPEFLGSLSEYALLLIVPMLAMFITKSMTNYYYIIPAIILGYIADGYGIGFLGGIIIGIFVGSFGFYCNKFIFSDNSFKKWGSVVLYNIIIFGVVFLLNRYIISPPLLILLNSVYDFLFSIDKTEVVFLVAIVAALTSIDMGGPLNKIAFSFILASFIEGYYYITGPSMIAVTIPPLSMGLAMLLYKNRFNDKDKSTTKFAFIASTVGMTEGALAVAFRRPHKLIPIIVLGSVTGTVFGALFGLENNLIMGSIPGLFGVNNILVYLLGHAIGVGVILLIVPFVLKKEIRD